MNRKKNPDKFHKCRQIQQFNIIRDIRGYLAVNKHVTLQFLERSSSFKKVVMLINSKYINQGQLMVVAVGICRYSMIVSNMEWSKP